jgi:hypothetical protein
MATPPVLSFRGNQDPREEDLGKGNRRRKEEKERIRKEMMRIGIICLPWRS